MKNAIQLFNFEDKNVRTVMINNIPYFVGKDVTEILGYKNSSKALNDHVDVEDKLNNETLSSLGQRGGWLVNESGLYSLILSSKMPKAKKFKRWVTNEVLPSIGHTGSYQIPKTPEEQLFLTMQVTNRLVGRMDKAEKDIIDLKENSEITSSQAKVLMSARRRHIVSLCGGIDSNFYKAHKAGEIFKEFGKDFKDRFQVARYDGISKKDYEEAINFTKEWYPDYLMKQEIEEANKSSKGQTDLFEDEGE